MKTIKKIVFKNTLGITEKTLEPGQINIIVGKKGTGKTSVLDAINLTLSNKNIRTEFIKKGEKEASMYIELSDGTVIDRTKSLDKSDKIMVKKDGVISSPETYLKSLFANEQFRPISFVESTTKEQNKVLLSLVDIKWSMADIEKWFGEIPDGINYSQHILNILDDIQSKRGSYYLTREELNRDIKNKKAIAEDILKNVPEGYNAETWRNTSLAEFYGKVTKAQNHNKEIEENEIILLQIEDRKQMANTNYKLEVSEIEANISEKIRKGMDEKEALQKRIDQLKNEMNAIDLRRAEILNSKTHLIENAATKRDSELKLIEHEENKAKSFSNKPIEVMPLKEAAEHAEKMKAFLNEYDNAMRIHGEVGAMQEKSNELSDKIEIARNLPTQLLKTVKSPVEGLSVADGVPLIKGLPIQNMSTGEQLELAVEIAKQLSGELGVILVDRLESLDSKSQDKFVETCKKSGLQFFMTKVADSEYDVIKV